MKLPSSPCCNTVMAFRDSKNKYGARGIGIKVLKLKCPKCGEQWLTTDGKDSQPYQTKKRKDPDERKVHINARMKQWKINELHKDPKYGSTQKWVDEKAEEIIKTE